MKVPVDFVFGSVNTAVDASPIGLILSLGEQFRCALAVNLLAIDFRRRPDFDGRIGNARDSRVVAEFRHYCGRAALDIFGCLRVGPDDQISQC